MRLDEFLEKSGWSKSAVARKCGISRAALTSWTDEIPEKHAIKLAEVLLAEEPEPKIVRNCHPADMPDDELKEIIRTRSGTSDYDICQAHGWRIWEFNEAIAGWVKRNPYKKPEKGYDLSKYVKGGVVDKETGELK